MLLGHLYAIEDCHAAYFLQAAGVERLDLMEDVSAHSIDGKTRMIRPTSAPG